MISLIATVLNEGQSIHRLMRSLAAQTRLPDEVVIVDGGSRDDTIAIIQSYADKLPLRVLVEPGCNISAGRNRAIAAAKGDIIVATDAGVELAADWLEKLTQPFLTPPPNPLPIHGEGEQMPDVQVVGGFFRAQAKTRFVLAMGATVLPLVEEVNPATFLPSSRSVAFRKTAWEAIGGYPEWLDYCEDLVFDFRLKMFVAASDQLSATSQAKNPISDAQSSVLSTQSFVFVPDALVDFCPRGSFRSFFKQYYFYSRGDGKANLWLKRHLARYLTYLVATPLVFVAGLLVHPLVWLLYIPGAIYYFYTPYRRLAILARRLENRTILVTRYSLLITVLLIPLIRVVGDIAKMIGYPVGMVWRLRHSPPDWRIL